MVEGVFSKADGEILYASEVNRFARGGGVIGTITPSANLASGTAYTDIGSIVIGAGSLTNPCFIQFTSFLNRGFDGSGAMQVQLSGGTANNFTISSDFVKALVNTKFEFTAMIGSTTEIDNEQQHSAMCFLTIGGTPGVIHSSGGEIAMHPNSGLAIIWRGRTDRAQNTFGVVVSPAIITFDRNSI